MEHFNNTCSDSKEPVFIYAAISVSQIQGHVHHSLRFCLATLATILKNQAGH